MTDDVTTGGGEWGEGGWLWMFNIYQHARKPSITPSVWHLFWKGGGGGWEVERENLEVREEKLAVESGENNEKNASNREGPLWAIVM